MGGVTPGTLRAKPSKNQFAFANYTLAEGSRCRFRYVVPFHVLNIAAAVANKMVVFHSLQIEPPGAAPTA